MFVVALRLEFQPLWGQIIHRDPVLSLDSTISNLVIEETHFHSLSTIASTSSSESEIVYVLYGPRTTTTILYFTIYKRTGHTDYLYRHFRSCNHSKKIGHVERKFFILHPELLVQAQQQRKQQGLPPLCTSSAGSRIMLVVYLPSDPTDIPHQLA